MSRQLEKQLFKSLSAASRSYSSYVGKLNDLRVNLDQKYYPSLLKVHYDVGSKKIKNRAWPGVREIKDLGFDCIIQSKGLDDDLIFCSNWLALHAEKINHFIEFSLTLQEEVLDQKYTHALSMALEFQKKNGWSFWALESIYFLTYKSLGDEAVRELTKKVKAQADKKIIGFAATIFLERIDERYSVDAFLSRWQENITKYIKTKRSQDYYLFRSMGYTPDLEKCLGNVLCQDFSNSIYDCFYSFIETAVSIIAAKKTGNYEALIASIQNLRNAGIQDFRLHKLLFNLTSNYSYYSDNFADYPLANSLSDKLIYHSKLADDHSADLESINLLNEQGAAAFNELAKLEKLGLSLRFLPVGQALSELGQNCIAKKAEDIISQPWASLLSSKLRIEECFLMPFDKAWRAIEDAAKNCKNDEWTSSANALLNIKTSSDELRAHLTLPYSSLLWLGYYFLETNQHTACGLVIEHLSGKGGYWERQSVKLKIFLLCANLEYHKAVNLAYSVIKNSHISSFEYPLSTIFEGNSWTDFREMDPKLVAIIAHFTNASLVKPDDDISYICKMACKKISENGDREALISETSERTDDHRKLIISLFYNVWTEENLTFLTFKTSREVMHERLEVLRLLVQLDPKEEQIYASEIMDITLRDTLWEGLSHIEETRIFVNEAGITRWAEKELRQDFDNWKEFYSLSVEDSLVDKLVEYSHSPSSERLEELSGGDLSEDNKLLLSIMERLESKFLNDPLDGLHCYLSARIRHGTIKNTYLGPIDEAGFLVVKGNLDESLGRYLEHITQEDVERIIKPALIELSKELVALIDDALANKIRIKSKKHPHGYIEICHDSNLFGRIAAALGSKLEFHQFISSAFSIFWKLLEPSLKNLHKYFDEEFQNKTHTTFDLAIQRIDGVGDEARALSGALTRIKNLTCQKCTVAANWFQPGSHISDRVFSLGEAINIANKASKNTYRRFNAEVIVTEDECLSINLSAIGMAAIVECLNTLLENCWKYSGLGDSAYNINVGVTHDNVSDIICITVENPLSQIRMSELTQCKLHEIRAKFQSNFEAESIATEGGSGLPKIARLSHHIDRCACPSPLDIIAKDGIFKVTAFVPIHKREEVYDVYNY